MKERKPDGGLAEWIETLEAMDGDDDGEMLCLLLELRRFREDKPALIEQLEAAQRERDELLHKDYLTWHAAACKFRQRAEAAEAELKRRDAQKPVAWQYLDANGNWQDEGDPEDAKNLGFTVRPLYAAAPAAATEKVVKLPKLCVGVVQSGHAVMVPYKGGHWFNKTAIQEALDAAGVKWIEGE